MSHNVMLAGVGGQGLVLMTKILSQAAFNEGFDVKTNDVVGLSQRGGMVYSSVRYGEKIYSPNIRIGTADALVSLEPLEGLRWSHMLSSKGLLIMNTAQIYPTMVQQGKVNYPEEEIKALHQTYSVFEIDAKGEAKKIGKPQVVNTIVLGLLSVHLSLSEEAWIASIKKNVKFNTIDLNLQAFEIGRNLKKANLS